MTDVIKLQTTIEQRINKRRKQKGLTIKELCAESGVSHKTMERLSYHKEKCCISLHTLVKIANVLDISLSELFKDI